MSRRHSDSFFGPALLAWEAQQVIALRLAKLAWGGPAALAETQLMISEKVAAATTVAGMMSMAMACGVFDGGAGEVTNMLRQKVRANRTRLTG